MPPKNLGDIHYPSIVGQYKLLLVDKFLCDYAYVSREVSYYLACVCNNVYKTNCLIFHAKLNFGIFFLYNLNNDYEKKKKSR